MSRIERSDVAKQTLRSEVAREQIQQYEKGKGKAPAKKTKDAKPTDELTRGRTAAAPAADSAQQGPAAGTARGVNPFAKLAQQLAGFELPPRVLAKALGMEADVDVPAKLLEGLGDVESAAAGMQSEGLSTGLRRATSKVRQGLMLTLSDGVEAKCNDDTKVPRGLASHISESMADVIVEEKGAAMKSAMFAAQTRFPAGMDVTAFVQAVLRESYLLQTEIMRDYAEKVKYQNDLKKAIRDKIRKARSYNLALKDALNAARDGEEDVEFPPEFDFSLFFEEHNEEFAVDWQAIHPEPESDGDGAGGTDPAGTSESGQSGSLDSDASAFSTDVVELPVALRGDFAQVTGPLQSEINTVRSFINSLGTGSWEEKKAAYAKYFWETCGSIKAGRAKIERVVPYLSKDQVRRLFEFAAWVDNAGLHTDKYNKTEKKHKEWLGGNILKSILHHATGSQLTYLQEHGAQDRLARGDSRYGTSWRTRANQYSEARSRLWGEWTTDPALQEVAALCADCLSQPEGSFHRAAALKLLKEKMWTLSADQVRSVLEGIASSGPKPSGDTLYEILAAADWRVVFASQAPSDWEFLAEAGGKASTFFREWAGEPEVVGDEAPDSSQMNGAGGLESSGSALRTDPEGGSNEPSEAPPEDEKKIEYPDGMVPSDETMELYLKTLEEELETAGDDAQLANVDLQNALQQQQQTLQMMSNISKMLHDTAMSIIRKLGS